MNRGKTSVLAASVLLLTSITAQATSSSATAPVHRHHHAHSQTQASRASLSLDEPGLRSSAALVLDETHSTVLYSRHADVAMPIASISKLVTALTVADAKQPMDEVIEITEEDRAIGKGAFSRLGRRHATHAWRLVSPGPHGLGKSRRTCVGA